MLEEFERFTKQGRSFNPKISIRKRGQIGFNNGAINRFSLKDFTYAVMYISPGRDKIAIQFTNDESSEGAVRIVKKSSNFYFSGKSFLDYYDIPYGTTEAYDAEWHEEEKAALITISKSGGNKDCEEREDDDPFLQ